MCNALKCTAMHWLQCISLLQWRMLLQRLTRLTLTAVQLQIVFITFCVSFLLATASTASTGPRLLLSCLIILSEPHRWTPVNSTANCFHHLLCFFSPYFWSLITSFLSHYPVQARIFITFCVSFLLDTGPQILLSCLIIMSTYYL